VLLIVFCQALLRLAIFLFIGFLLLLNKSCSFSHFFEQKRTWSIELIEKLLPQQEH
jgi:hypothetical protein